MQPGFRKALVHWYTRHARSLPWRDQPTPYRVWISEIMLQQTRVEVVRDYYQRFVRRFPTIKALAAAELEDVLAAWSGLGYYRRARMLHDAARVVVAQHGGRLPADHAALLTLPGIGRYTAGAIASIAFDQPAAIVDGNIERVFARLTALPDNVKAAGGKAIWQLANEHVTRGVVEGHSASALNQALMELGATVCKPTPACPACPVKRWCASYKAGAADQYPVLPARKAAVQRRYLFALVRDADGRVLLSRREAGDASSLLPGGLWELPHTEQKRGSRQAWAAIQGALGATLTPTGKPVTRAHAIMRYKLELVAQPCTGDVPVRNDVRWFTLEAACKAAIASATRKLLESIMPVAVSSGKA
jgi:A/G-specific adenine glycosylase